jgi:outer membrane protein OmpA-like peptidoglycan-associated protein
MAMNSYAVNYENKMDQAHWNVDSSPLECSMSQSVRGVMVASFYQKAGHKNTFKGDLSKFNNVSNVGVLIESPFWSNNKINPIEVTSSAILDREFELSEEESKNVIVSLQDGYVASFKLDNGDSVNVLPTGFKAALNQYNECMAQLIPAGFEKVELTVIKYPLSTVNISKKFKNQLNDVIEYYKVAKNVDRIVIDGHSDKSGKSLINRDLSKKRAQLIQDYLHQKGVPKEKLVTRFHGEMYPIASNSNAAGRYANRRVTVRIQENVYPIRKEANKMDIYDHFIETHKVIKSIGAMTFKDEDEVLRVIEASEVIDSLSPDGDTLMVERLGPDNLKSTENMANAIESVSGIDADNFVGDEDGLAEALQKSQEEILESKKLELKNLVTLAGSLKSDQTLVKDIESKFSENLLSDAEMVKVQKAFKSGPVPVLSEADKRVMKSIAGDDSASVLTGNEDEKEVSALEEETLSPFSYFDLNKTLESKP